MTSTLKLDPVVQEQLSVGETTLAEFMDGLSKTITRYNTLLAKALPQNPKAHFYYYNENEGEEKKEAGDESAASTEKKPKLDGDALVTEGSVNPEGKKPTSPLLRRPQLPKEEMAKIKEEAKKELMKRQSSVGDFPIVGDEEEKPVKAHTKSHTEKKKKATAGHHHHGTKKSNKDNEVKEDADAEEEEKTTDKKAHHHKKASGAKKAGKAPKSILPKLFGKDAGKKEEATEEDGKDPKSPVKVLSAAEAAADADDWEDETDEEDGAGGEMTVDQLFAKIAPSPQLLQEIRVLKTEARDLSQKFEIIHDWIAMNLPALATEDDQSTSVMGAIIESLTGFMSTVDDIYQQEAAYLAERAQLELTFLQNPEIATGLALIALLDNDAWDSIEVGYRAMMRCYLIAHSQLAKNMEQLRAPIRRRVNLSM